MVGPTVLHDCSVAFGGDSLHNEMSVVVREVCVISTGQVGDLVNQTTGYNSQFLFANSNFSESRSSRSVIYFEYLKEILDINLMKSSEGSGIREFPTLCLFW